MSTALNRMSDKFFSFLSYVHPKYEKIDGRYISFLVLFMYHAAYRFYPTGKWHDAPAHGKAFWDTWVVLRAIECLDGIKRNDSLECFFNFIYPKLGWRVFTIFNINADDHEIYGVCLMVVFFTSCFLIFKKLTLGQGVFLALVLISFPVQLGTNAGNPDLLIFVLLVIAVFAFQKTKFPLIAQSIVFFTGMLKYYTFILCVLLIKKRRDMVLAGVCILLGGAYILYTKQDMASAAAYFQANESVGASFGCAIFFKLLSTYPFLDFFFKIINYKILGQLLMSSVLLFAFYKYMKSYAAGSEIRVIQTYSFVLFRFGYLIFLTCFVIGINYDYRLVCLILLLPFFFEQMNTYRQTILELLALILFVFIIHSFGLERVSFLLYTVIEEFANWVLLYLLTKLFLTTLPEEIQLLLSNYIIKRLK